MSGSGLRSICLGDYVRCRQNPMPPGLRDSHEVFDANGLPEPIEAAITPTAGLARGSTT